MALSIAGILELLEKEFDWVLFILSIFIASLSIAAPVSFSRYRVTVTDDYVEVIQVLKWLTKRVYFKDVVKLRLHDGTLYIFATSGKASVFYAIEQYERVIQTVVDKVKQNPGIEYDFNKHELAKYVWPIGKEI